jgi:hypothetical protein
MTFHLDAVPTIGEIAELASLAKDTPYAGRVEKLGAYRFRFAEDRRRATFMFKTDAVSRPSSAQDLYLLYFMRTWFDIRTKSSMRAEVSFYDFPARLETERYWIQQCFSQAARVHGWMGDPRQEPAVFEPVFCEDDWPAFDF